MSEMVERVAKVLHSVRGERYRKWFVADAGEEPKGIEYEFPTWKNLRHADRQSLIDEARAAIAAMREPTEEMLVMGSQYCELDLDTWQGIIDAALK